MNTSSLYRRQENMSITQKGVKANNQGYAPFFLQRKYLLGYQL